MKKHLEWDIFLTELLWDDRGLEFYKFATAFVFCRRNIRKLFSSDDKTQVVELLSLHKRAFLALGYVAPMFLFVDDRGISNRTASVPLSGSLRIGILHEYRKRASSPHAPEAVQVLRSSNKKLP